jgi:hypothetical protein
MTGGSTFKAKGASARAKDPTEDSLVVNTATLRNMFAKSAKLESYDILETTGKRRACRGECAPAASVPRQHAVAARIRTVLTRARSLWRDLATSAQQARARLGGYGCAGTRTRGATLRLK